MHSTDPNLPEFVRNHTIVTGVPQVTLMTAQKPRFDVATPGENAALEKGLSELGIIYVPTLGMYGEMEDSYIIHGLSLGMAYTLGQVFGQESVIHNDRGDLRMLYTNGPNRGLYALGLPEFEWFPERPSDFWTQLPEGGYLRLQFVFDMLHRIW
jgi:hypothetical protein